MVRVHLGTLVIVSVAQQVEHCVEATSVVGSNPIRHICGGVKRKITKGS